MGELYAKESLINKSETTSRKYQKEISTALQQQHIRAPAEDHSKKLSTLQKQEKKFP